MSKITVTDADVQALLDFHEDSENSGAPKRLETLRAILAGTAAQATQLRALNLRAQLDAATLKGIDRSMKNATTVVKLRELFDAPAGSVNMQEALNRTAALEQDIANATSTTQTFVSIAQFAVGVAKLIV